MLGAIGSYTAEARPESSSTLGEVFYETGRGWQGMGQFIEALSESQRF